MNSSLEYLLGTYFHQDLYSVHGDEWGAVDAFITRDPHRLPGLAEEIDQLLASHTSEEALSTFVTDTGCEFAPDEADGGYRGWLTEIARRVRAATA